MMNVVVPTRDNTKQGDYQLLKSAESGGLQRFQKTEDDSGKDGNQRACGGEYGY